MTVCRSAAGARVATRAGKPYSLSGAGFCTSMPMRALGLGHCCRVLTEEYGQEIDCVVSQPGALHFRVEDRLAVGPASSPNGIVRQDLVEVVVVGAFQPGRCGPLGPIRGQPCSLVEELPVLRDDVAVARGQNCRQRHGGTGPRIDADSSSGDLQHPGHWAVSPAGCRHVRAVRQRKGCFAAARVAEERQPAHVGAALRARRRNRWARRPWPRPGPAGGDRGVALAVRQESARRNRRYSRR